MSIQFREVDLNYRIDSTYSLHQMNDDLKQSHYHGHRILSRQGTYNDINVWIVESLDTIIDGKKVYINGVSMVYSCSYKHLPKT